MFLCEGCCGGGGYAQTKSPGTYRSNIQAGASRAEYGQRVINDLAEKLSAEFGRGFDIRELRRYRQFYLLFLKWDALRPELTWTHYRTLIRVENERARLCQILNNERQQSIVCLKIQTVSPDGERTY